MATSTLTQLLSSENHPEWFSPVSSVLLYAHRDPEDSQGRGALDGHLDFYTAHVLSSVSAGPEFQVEGPEFPNLLCPRRLAFL